MTKSPVSFLATRGCLHCRLFDATSVEGIIEKLNKDGSPFARKQAEVCIEKSILSDVIWLRTLLFCEPSQTICHALQSLFSQWE